MTKYTDITEDILKDITLKQDSEIEIHISKYDPNKEKNSKCLSAVFLTLSKNKNLKNLIFRIDSSSVWNIDIKALDTLILFLAVEHEQVKINLSLRSIVDSGNLEKSYIEKIEKVLVKNFSCVELEIFYDRNLIKMKWISNHRYVKRNQLISENLKNNRFIKFSDKITFSKEALEYFFAKKKSDDGLESIKGVIFENCTFDPEAFQIILENLQHTKNLEHLEFQKTKLTDDNVVLLAKLLADKIFPLRTLNLANNEISQQGIAALVEALKESATFLNLNVAFNRIGDEGIKPLTELITHKSSSLASLNISYNDIKNEGLINLAKSLANNHSLIQLVLNGNPIPGTIVETLGNCLKNNKSLTQLFLSGTNVNEEAANRLIEILDPSQDPQFAKKKKKPTGNSRLTNLLISHSKVTYNSGAKVSLFVNKIKKYLNNNKQLAGVAIDAVVSGKLEKLKELLTNGTVSIFIKNEEEDSLLNMAVKHSQYDIAKYLLESGINRKLFNKQGKTALDLAKEKEDEKMIALLTQAVAMTKPSLVQALITPIKKPIKKRKNEEGETYHNLNKDEVLDELGEDIPFSNKKPKFSDEVIEDANLNFLDDDELTSLYVLVNDLLEKRDEEHKQRKKLKSIYTLIKNGAQTNIFADDPILKVKLTVLHKAVAYDHYRLMKLILSSPNCDPNSLDSQGWTALDWAINRNNLEIVNRLLIDHRLALETVNSAMQHAAEKAKQQKTKNNNSDVIDTIVQLLQKRHAMKLPAKESGIQFIQKFSVVYGSRNPKKSVRINAEKEHAQLAVQNNFSRQRLFEPEVDNKKDKIKDMAGNPVTASLAFIVSTKRYKQGENYKRCKIRVKIDFTENYHVNGADADDVVTEKAKERIIARAEAAPKDIFDRKSFSPHHPETIEVLYKAAQENSDPTYQQAFHHGEQALLNYLEQEQTIGAILNQLLHAEKFNQGCKVYGVILDIHSPRYVCENCEVGLLGVQNSEQSLFLKLLGQKLVSVGCILPQYSPIRMLIQASGYIPYHSEQVTDKEHELLTIDMRACQNLILAKDLSAFDSQLTQHHSRKFES